MKLLYFFYFNTLFDMISEKKLKNLIFQKNFWMMNTL